MRYGGDRRHRRRRQQLFALGLLLVAVCLVSVSVGAVTVRPGQVLGILVQALTGIDPGAVGAGWLGDWGRREETVLMAVRLPRLILGLLIGAALGISGAVLQGLFRNPLADPALIGVATGAALGAVMMIVLGAPLIVMLPYVLGQLMIPAAAFVSGLLVTALVYGLSQRQGGTDVSILLLAGVAMNAISAAVVGLMVFISNDQELRDLNFWMLGSVAGASWTRILLILPFVAIACGGLLTMWRFLNAVLLGEEAAAHLGLNVERTKRLAVLFVALATAGAVAMTGVVAFVGLTVPHIIRLLFGPDHRVLLPGSVLGGALVIVVADLLARTLAVPADLPLGVVMSLAGGPFFIWLLVRKRGLGQW